MIANADKFINQIYDKPESLFDYLDRNTLVFASEFTAIQERGKSMDFISNETLMQGFEDGTLCRGFDRFALTFNECTEFCRVTEQSCLKTLFTEACLSSCRKS